MSNDEYLKEQGVQETLSAALSQVLKERPANALARLAELISPAPAATDDYLSTVGNTPMIKLGKMLPPEVKAKAVYVKMEMQNPGGSIKDRIALNIINEAEKAGRLKPGMTIVEATSGNTGIGLAMVAAAKGYKCIIMMPQVPPMMERYMIVRQFGAEVILTAPGKGFPGLMAEYQKILDSDPSVYFGANQFTTDDNPAAHYQTTGPEVWAQTMGEVDIFIHGIGTGGTIAGTAKFLKEKKPSVKTVAIEPSNSRVHIGDKPNPHTILGIGAGVPTNFLGLVKDENGKSVPFSEPTSTPFVDEWAHASSDEAVEYALKATTLEGMMIGPSAGAALKVAVDVACRPESEGKTLVVIMASHGIRYAAHPLWSAVKKEAAAALPMPPNLDKGIETIQWKSSDYTPA